MGWLAAGRVLWRRWFVTVPVALLALVAVWQASHPRPVYWTSFQVQFMLPETPKNPNAYLGATESLISAAGLVANDVSDHTESARTTSSEAPLIGLSVRQGYSVSLINSGGQWAYNFDRPVLAVQVVGMSRVDVSRRQREVLDKVNSALRAREQIGGADPALPIRYRSVPASPGIAVEAGHPFQALVAGLIVAVGTTAAVTLLADRLLLRSRRRRAARPSSSPRWPG